MEHAVLGAGAIGGLVGTAVASLGEGVTVLVRPERLPGYPANLSVERPSGAIAITAPAKVAATLTNPVDELWIATKTYQLKTALQAVQSLPRYVVPLLNGVDHVEFLRVHFGTHFGPHFGDDRVLPATIAVEAERIAPGRFVQRSPFVNLNLPASGEQALGAIVARLRDLEFTCAGFPDLSQPLGAMAGIVDVPARTGNRPAAIQRFQAIHDSRQIFDDRQVAPGEFSQHPHARLAMVDRLEIIEA